MKKALLFGALLLSFTFVSFSLTIPKKLIGQYEAEVPRFEFLDKGRIVKASGFKLSIILREDFMIYRSGILNLEGIYTEVKEESGIVDIAIEMSNDISIEFDIDLSVNSKTSTITVRGLKGVPEVTLIKRTIQINKKNP